MLKSAQLDTASEGSQMVEIKRYGVGERMSQLVVAGGLAFVAGQVADDTSLDVAGQTRQILDKIDRLLSAANASDGTASRTFAYDDSGNMTNNSGVGAYSYPTPGQPRPPALSKFTQIMWRCRCPKPSASSTGRWKKPRSVVSRRKKN